MIVLLLGFLFSCQHGPLCSTETIDFTKSAGATEYTLYWKANTAVVDPNYWETTVDLCPATPPILTAEQWNTYMCADEVLQDPWCRDSCQVYIRHPSPGNVIFFSLTASNEAGESGH